MIIITKYLVPKSYLGITLFPFIFVKDQYLKSDTVFINHEKIHLRQQLELLILPFFLWYALEYIIRIFQYGHFKKAYRNISFEREAYANESNLNYIKVKRIWSFLNYL